MKDTSKLSALESLVYFAIPEGKENAVTRGYLAGILGLRDRQVRRTIAKLRELGFPVLSGDEPGYWRSKDTDEIARFKRREAARAKSITDAIANM